MQLIAQTPRFSIRNLQPGDQQAYMSLFDDKQVTLHLPKRNRAEILETFRVALKDDAVNKATGRWGIFNNTDGEFIGFCLLRNYDNAPEKIELGYVLAQKYWGKGIAGEMATIMIAYGFTHTGATEIVALTTPGNIGSQKVLEKAGMERMDNIFRDREELAYFSIEKNSSNL